MVSWKYFLPLLMTLLCVGRAHAATVAILRPAADSTELGEALFRMKGELLAVGLAVVLVERPPEPDTRSATARAWLERRAEERDLEAFIDVVGGATLVAVDVWLWERSARRLSVTRVALEPEAPDASATAAIRAIEVLRSSLLVRELPALSARESGPARELPPEPRSVPEQTVHVGFAAGAAAVAGLDGVGASFLPLVRSEWFLGSWVALQATAAGFGSRPRVASEAGSADVSRQYALLGVCACSSDFGLRPVLSLAMGFIHTSLDGRANSPNVGHRADHWALLMEASAGLRLNVPDRYHLTLASHAQLAEPSATVHIGDSVVATTGRPNLLLSLTLGVWL